MGRMLKGRAANAADAARICECCEGYVRLSCSADPLHTPGRLSLGRLLPLRDPRQPAFVPISGRGVVSTL